MQAITRKAGAAFLFLCMALAALPLPILAQNATSTADSGTGVGFYVRAIVPENQVDASKSYFDLRMQPGQTQRLQIEIVNETNEPLAVDISAISASTARTGIIDYRTPDIRDETLQIPFSEIAQVETGTVNVAANGTAMAAFSVTMPAAEYDGVILGGIVLTKQNEPSVTNESGGASINNIYNYVIGVQLRETDTDVLPDFELVDVEAGLVNYMPAFVHYIRNKEAAVVKGMHLNATVVRASDGEIVAQVDQEDVDMAPNSVLPLAISLLSGGQLQPGDYNTVVELELGGETWRFERLFVVGRADADAVNGSALIEETKPAIPIWVWILLGILLLLILLLLFILFKRRRKEDEEEDEIEIKKLK